MLAQHARIEPLANAVSDTFGGEMCDICRMVARAHKEEKSHSPILALKLQAKGLLFFPSTETVVVVPPRGVVLIDTSAWVSSRGRSMPPVPPPRAEVV